MSRTPSDPRPRTRIGARRRLATALLSTLAVVATMLIVAPPATAVLGPGSRGKSVTYLQTRLRWAGLYPYRSSGYYSSGTARAVRHFQEKYLLPRTGRADPATLHRLRSVTWRRGVLPERCRTGRIICVDKTLRLLRDLDDGHLIVRLDARFGKRSTPTRDGLFRVFRRRTLAISTVVPGAQMPWSLFFSGGQAVHYSYSFARNAYNGGSHGCINLRSWDAARALYYRTPIGRRVYVYR